jgi:hypothetical protein
MRLRLEIKWIAISALLLSLSAPAATVLPDWMKQAASQTLPAFPPDTNAVVLLDDTTYTINGPAGDVTEHHRRVVKILRPEGRSEAYFAVGYRKGEKVNSVHAWSVDTSGHEYEVKDKEFIEVSSYTEALYDDLRARTARVPAADKGTIAAFEYDAQRHRFLDELHWWAQKDIPVVQSIFTIQLPAGYEYKDLWANTNPVKAVSVGNNRWQWTKTNLPAIEKEERRPSLDALAARMQVNYFGGGSAANTEGWLALGQWYNGLTADRRVATPEITDKVHQITAGKTDFDGKARAVSEFMQAEVRYVLIDIGIGGYQPHPASDVFRFRYGDCKDKATLMSTMLRETGITSHYVIIHTERGVAREDVPSSIFDHAILAIEVPSDADASKYQAMVTAKSGQKMLLFDPTDSYTPLGEIGSHIQDRYAMLVTPAGGEVIHTPVLAPDANRLIRRGSFTLSADGRINGNVTETRSGETASDWRSDFRSSNEQERTKSVESSVSRSLSTAHVENIKLEALDRRNENLITRYDVSSDRYAQVSGPLLLVRPRVLGRDSIGLEKKERKYPIELRSTARVDDEYTIEIPAGYVVDDMPSSMKAESSFGSYESHIDNDKTKLIYKRTFINRTLEVQTDKIAEYRTFQLRIAEDENSVVVLKKVN